MNKLLFESDNKWSIWLFAIVIVIIIGIYFRLDQFLLQILIDDEWHAVNQLLKSNPADIFTSFGHADHSIPLTLFYWFEAKFFGLSEVLMRWPVMLCGLLTLLLFSIYAYKKFHYKEAVLFGFLLASSPLLITYSRRARPYAITLFLVYFSHWLFYKYINNPNRRLFYGLIYCTSAALAIWLHLIVAFFIAAPFIYEFFKFIIKPNGEKWQKFKPLLYLGVTVLLLLSLLILPPLINDMSALSDKSGSSLITLDTLIGSIFMWFGSYSSIMVLCFSLFAIMGLPRLIKISDVSKSVLFGFMLTFIVILVIRPAFAQYSITFTRYVLPIIPLILMSVAIGFFVFIDLCTSKLRNQTTVMIVNIITVLVFITSVFITSPTRGLLTYPNSQSLHAKYNYDFRKGRNDMDHSINSRMISGFWQTLSSQPMHYKIAVAPWFYGSFHWDAPRWEQISKQYTIPGFLTGLCTKVRTGELPDNKDRFDFRNVSFLNNPEDVKSRNIDFIVYQKPARLNFSDIYGTLENCDVALQNLYGSPYYEDELIIVFNTSTDKQL